MNIRTLTVADTDALAAFFGTLSERDLTLIREDLSDPTAVGLLIKGGPCWVAVDEDARIIGYVSVARLPGWSNHVGELRLVVGPNRRGGGIGRALAQHAIRSALSSGTSKLIVELAADQESAAAMFASLGFSGESLMRDHIRDREGRFHDLIVLAHNADENWSAIDAVGIADVVPS